MFKSVRRVLSGVLAFVGIGATGVASAAVPAVVGTTIDAIQVDALAVIDLVWPVLITIFGGVLLMKVAKRVMNKI